MSALFGTDGIRGLANYGAIIPEIVTKIGAAIGASFHKNGHKNIAIIAKDTRLSGYLLEHALTSGLLSVGVDVILVGPMPTPALSMLVPSMRADIGVMISASHNPYYDNGFKIFDSKGAKLTDYHQEVIEKLVQQDLRAHFVQYEHIGRAKRLEDASGRYIEYAKSVIPKDISFDGLKIVLDCANGSAYSIAPTIFWELGAKVHKLACEPNGTNINHNCGALFTDNMCTRVLEFNADIGIALDGDADRMMICDEQGKLVSTEHVIGALASKLHREKLLYNDGVAVTNITNSGLDAYLTSLGVHTFRTKVGDKYVGQCMKKHGLVIGGEPSGHIIYGSGGAGDGIIASLLVISYLIQNNMKCSQIRDLFAARPQITRSLECRDKNLLNVPKIQDFLDELRQKYTSCVIIVRASGTEPVIRIVVEGEDDGVIQTICDSIEQFIKLALL